MALLSESNRIETWEALMRINESTYTINRNDLKDAIDAIDVFLENNASTINNAFPEPAKTNLTIPQKAHLLARVTLKRWGG